MSNNAAQKQLFLLTGYVADLTDEISAVVTEKTNVHQQIMDATERGLLIATLNGFNTDKEACAQWLGLTVEAFMERVNYFELSHVMIGEFVGSKEAHFPDDENNNAPSADGRGIVTGCTVQGYVPESDVAAIEFCSKLLKANYGNTEVLVNTFTGAINVQMNVLRGLFPEEATPGINSVLATIADSTTRVEVVATRSPSTPAYH